MSDATEPAVTAGSMVTPPAWRVAALATLGGGIAVGALAATGSAAGWVVAGSIGVVVAELLPILGASRRPPIPPDPAPLDPDAAPPTISVVVAGRDEANVLPQLVADVAAQDHRDPAGRPRFELVVVDDRSTDGTAAAVTAAALAHGIQDVTTVIRRDGEGLPDGKGAALTAAQPERCRGDVVLVLDADARIGPGLPPPSRGLRRRRCRRRHGPPADPPRRVVAGWPVPRPTSRRRTASSSADAGPRAAAPSSGATGSPSGASLLASVGGWRAAALTEDIDLSSRIAAAHGTTVAWAIDLEVWEEPVRAWSGLWRQRLRWSEGGLRRILEHGAGGHDEPAPVGPGAVRLRRLRRPAPRAAAHPRRDRRRHRHGPRRDRRRPRGDLPGGRRHPRLRRPALGGGPGRPAAAVHRAPGAVRASRALQRRLALRDPGGDVAPGDPPRPRPLRQDAPRRQRARSGRAGNDRAPPPRGGDLHRRHDLACAVDPVAGGNVPALSGADDPRPGRRASTRSPRSSPIDLGRTPASHFTFEGLFEIADAIRAPRPTRRSTVSSSSRGPTSIEETAFFWDLVLDGPTPVVVTGAMRSASEPDYDGPANLRDAVTVRGGPAAPRRGRRRRPGRLDRRRPTT